MKKLLLSGFVVVAFILYSYHQRNETSGPVLAPSSSTTTNTSTNAPSPSSTGSSGSAASSYKDGTYTGSVADAFYGNVQVQVTVSNGKISGVQFLQYPNDNRNSQAINSQAMPYLQQEAISAQSAHVDIITGATDTSMAFIQSLTSALANAR